MMIDRKNDVMERPFNPLDYGIALSKPRRLTDITSWHLHIPFAFAIMAMLRPKILVELGTHKGDSYCAFCQAADELALNTACHAVDSWQGDEHSGHYGQEVLDELRTHHNPLYGHFSRLVKCLFDEALHCFSDGSIDLLHIDGHHTYESVRHDFESWLPKMSSRGIVLLHDSNVREREFGVWRLWNEVSSRHPGFEFRFGNGLGVLAVGAEIEDEVRSFLEYGKDHETAVSDFFYHLGTKNILDYQHAGLSEQVHHLETALSARDIGLQQTDEQLRRSAALIREKDRQLEEVHELIRERDCRLEEGRILVEDKNRRLEEIYASRGWRWLTRYRKIKSLWMTAK
jgi:hypothetical protein